MWGDDSTALVVDDDEGCRELHSYWLDREFTVETAADGEAALSTVAQGNVDLIVLDRQMPGLTGVEVLHRLEKRGFDGCVIMVTGVTPGLDLVDLAVDDYLVKPISETELRGAIDRLRQRQDYHDQLRELFSLANKKARLEMERSRADLAASSEYERLTEALNMKRRAIGRAVDADEEAWLTAVEACRESPGTDTAAVASRGHEI